MKKQQTVFVGMSGGVDSSVAAYLLQKHGYDVVGVFLRCYNVDGCAERDAEDARRVAGKIGIPFYVWNFEEEYKRAVVDYMVREYRAGLTPNPDVMCNREIKFGLFFRRARELGADFVATGHYVKLKAKSEKRKTTYQLCQARDKNKDQSYFLWTLTPDVLAHCLFPIGEYTKPQVRVLARRAGLPTADKKDSQGICFLGDISVADFLKRYIKPKQGAIVTTEGAHLGAHDGAYFYTVGQRHLGIAKRKAQSAKRDFKPLYVAAKNVRTNTLTVAEGSDHPALYRQEVALRDVNLMNPSLLTHDPLPVYARVRYRQPLVRAELRVKRYGLRGGESSRTHNSSLITLHFESPVRFVAAGQSAVFYLPRRSSVKGGLEMLGGGVIE